MSLSYSLDEISRPHESRIGPNLHPAQRKTAVAIAPIDAGVMLPEHGLAIVSEQQLFGEKPRQRNRRIRKERDPETIIRQLNDLEEGSPVVHAEYGIGRYIGLITLTTGGIEAEFLHLQYADGDKLYVPVNALDLISRYTGASPENAPIHRLGSDQWAKAKKRADRAHQRCCCGITGRLRTTSSATGAQISLAGS